MTEWIHLRIIKDTLIRSCLISVDRDYVQNMFGVTGPLIVSRNKLPHLLMANAWSPTIIVLEGDSDRLRTTTIYPDSQGAYFSEISAAMPYGKVAPIDLLIVVAPMCFREYCTRLATKPPRTFMSLSAAHPNVVSDQPRATSRSLDGRSSTSNAT